MGTVTVREARQALNMRQDDLAAKTGIDQTTISDYENGRVGKPKRENLRRLARALRVPMDSLQFKKRDAGAEVA